MTHYIDIVDKAEFPEVVEVWEASVRATHYFLKEEDIEHYKPLILNEYLNAVQLRCKRDHEKQIIGFLGTAEGNLEMLFIHPDYLRKGLGKSLLVYSINHMDVNKVDVNEQNQQAVEFYRHSGFTTVGRSELDASGKPYPILHMELKK
jgi:putative acetyltransferase